MFGKLIKHEIKQTFRLVSTIYIILAALASFLLLTSLVGATFFRAVAYIVLMFASFAMVIMTVAAIVKNFNDSLFSARGYLSLTLPVKGSQLLLCKILVSILWMLCSLLLMMVVYFIVYLSSTGENGIELLGSIQEMINESGLSELLPSKLAMTKLIMFFTIALFMYFLIIIGQIYFAVAIANTRPFQKHTAAFGVAIFLIIDFALRSISQPLTQSFPLALHISQNDVIINFTSMANSEEIFSFGIAGLLLRTGVAVILLFVTGWILEHKVNIK